MYLFLNESDVRESARFWNSLWPIDLWWRYQNKVTWMSKKHKSMRFDQMMFELAQELLIKSIRSDKTEEMGMNEEEIDEAFENLDINI